LKKFQITNPTFQTNPKLQFSNHLLSFAKVMELVAGSFIWGRGGFSLPKSGRLKSPLPTREKTGCSFIYAKFNNIFVWKFEFSSLEIIWDLDIGIWCLPFVRHAPCSMPHARAGVRHGGPFARVRGFGIPDRTREQGGCLLEDRSGGLERQKRVSPYPSF
jgi:hypothetical protein